MNAEELGLIIRDEVDQRGIEVDMRDLTEAVVARIPDDQLREATHISMRQYIVERIGDMRRRAGVADEPQPAPAVGPSRRGTAAAAWRRKLDSLVSVQGSGVYKRLGACTVDDMRAISAAYASRAQSMVEQQHWYERIAEAMAATGATTVADLPAATLRPLVDQAAA